MGLKKARPAPVSYSVLIRAPIHSARERPPCRGRSRSAGSRGAGPSRRRPPDRDRREWHQGARGGHGQPLRRDRPGPWPARPRWPRGVPPPALERQRGAGAHAHRPRGRDRAGRGPRRRRRRLPREAVRARRAPRAAPRIRAPRAARRAISRHAAFRGRRPRPRRDDLPPRRSDDPAVAYRIPAARAVPLQSEACAQPRRDLRSRVGLRLRSRLELARRLHRVPPPKAWRATDHPHHAQRRLRVEGSMSFRLRVTLLTASAVAVAAIAAGAVMYLMVQQQIQSAFDDTLQTTANTARLGGPRPDDRFGGRGGGGAVFLSGRADIFAQSVDATGSVVGTDLQVGQQPELVTSEVLAVANGKRADGWADVTTATGHWRVYAVPFSVCRAREHALRTHRPRDHRSGPRRAHGGAHRPRRPHAAPPSERDGERRDAHA